MQPNLKTVRTLANDYPGVLTEGGLRWQIFNETKNGLSSAGAIVRVGRKVLIDTDRYFAWMYNQSKEK